jgi:hypothetical protein
MRALPVLALFVSSWGCGQPRAWIDVERIEGTRPEWAILRCRTSGFPKRPRFAWKLPGGVRPTGVGQPLDEDALQVQISDNLRSAEIVECAASGDKEAAARVALGPCKISATRLAAQLLTVEGSGFGSEGSGDELWLVPARGRARRADQGCKGGSWSDTRIIACLPPLAKGQYQVRVQSAGRLVLGPFVEAK